MSQDGAAEASQALAGDHSAAVAREASSPGGMRLFRLAGSSMRNRCSLHAPGCAPGGALPAAAASPAAQGCCPKLGCCGKFRCCVRLGGPLYPAATIASTANGTTCVSTAAADYFPILSCRYICWPSVRAALQRLKAESWWQVLCKCPHMVLQGRHGQMRILQAAMSSFGNCRMRPISSCFVTKLACSGHSTC